MLGQPLALVAYCATSGVSPPKIAVAVVAPSARPVRRGVACRLVADDGACASGLARAGAAWHRPHAAMRGRLAQLVERFLYTEDVGGSSPSAPTTP